METSGLWPIFNGGENAQVEQLNLPVSPHSVLSEWRQENPGETRRALIGCPGRLWHSAVAATTKHDTREQELEDAAA